MQGLKEAMITLSQPILILVCDTISCELMLTSAQTLRIGLILMDHHPHSAAMRIFNMLHDYFNMHIMLDEDGTLPYF